MGERVSGWDNKELQKRLPLPSLRLTDGGQEDRYAGDRQVRVTPDKRYGLFKKI
jgi:hypothetical protein